MDIGDVVRLVLERVDSQVSLIRSASTCKQWRRVIAEPSFLRRHRSLHAPTVAGDYFDYTCWPPYNFVCRTPHDDEAGPRRPHRPVFLPPPSTSPPPIDARRCSLDFLPDDMRSWTITDSRGGLLLMCRSIKPMLGYGGMVVCEPLTRRYKTVPDLPADLDGFRWLWVGAFLVDGDDADEAGDRIGMSNFRVLCRLHVEDQDHDVVSWVVQGAMFTATGGGGGGGSSSWSKKVVGSIDAGLRCIGRMAGSWCFYDAARRLFFLDGSTGEFSSSFEPLPPATYITDCRDGKPSICNVVYDFVEVFARRGDGEWVLEKRAQLSTPPEMPRGRRQPGHDEEATLEANG